MTRYHVNKVTGRSNICKADKRGCPLGADTPHFDTKEEAKDYIEAEAQSKHEKIITHNRQTAQENSARLLKEFRELHKFNVDISNPKEILAIINDPIGNPEKMLIITDKIRGGEIPRECIKVITQRKPISIKLQKAIMESPFSTYEDIAEVHNSNYSITAEYVKNTDNKSIIREMYPYLNYNNQATVMHNTNDEKLFNAAVRLLGKNDNDENRRWVAVHAYSNSNITREQKQKLANIDDSSKSLFKMEEISGNLQQAYHDALRETNFRFDETTLTFNGDYIKRNNLSVGDMEVLLNYTHDSWRGEIIKLRGASKYIYNPNSMKYYQ